MSWVPCVLFPFVKQILSHLWACFDAQRSQDFFVSFVFDFDQLLFYGPKSQLRCHTSSRVWAFEVQFRKSLERLQILELQGTRNKRKRLLYIYSYKPLTTFINSNTEIENWGVYHGAYNMSWIPRSSQDRVSKVVGFPSAAKQANCCLVSKPSHYLCDDENRSTWHFCTTGTEVDPIPKSDEKWIYSENMSLILASIVQDCW